MSRAQDLFDQLVRGGEAEVLSFINQPVTEELFLDYKRSADNGAGTSLHNRDRANLAKAISGFGNSEGGVVVWGVDCRTDPVRGDIPCGPVHIHDPVRFKSRLDQATSGLTIPPHTAVGHYAIPEGFVLSLIPMGMHAPYQTVGELSYHIRAGSNFVRAPHAVLAGMFGRRPQPAIKQSFSVRRTPNPSRGSVKTRMDIVISNQGRGLAENVFLNLCLKSHPGRMCYIKFIPPHEEEVWWRRFELKNNVHMVTRPGYGLSPDASLVSGSVDIVLQMPIERDFAFEGICGCSGGEPSRFAFVSKQEDILSAFQPFSTIPYDEADFHDALQRFNPLFFGDVDTE